MNVAATTGLLSNALDLRDYLRLQTESQSGAQALHNILPVSGHQCEFSQRATEKEQDWGVCSPCSPSASAKLWLNGHCRLFKASGLHQTKGVAAGFIETCGDSGIRLSEPPMTHAEFVLTRSTRDHFATVTHTLG